MVYCAICLYNATGSSGISGRVMPRRSAVAVSVADVTCGASEQAWPGPSTSGGTPGSAAVLHASRGERYRAAFARASGTASDCVAQLPKCPPWQWSTGAASPVATEKDWCRRLRLSRAEISSRDVYWCSITSRTGAVTPVRVVTPRSVQHHPS